MAGKRILDAASLFNASRSIVAKHVHLRRQQLEIYSKTSSLASAVKSQTDRVTVTASAAAALIRRFSDSGPLYATNKSGPHATTTAGSKSTVPSHETVRPAEGHHDGRQRLDDHFYNKSEENASVDPVPDRDLNVRQERPERYPLPDGTVPTGSAIDDTNRGREEVCNTRSTVESYKAPLERHKQEFPPTSSDRSSIPNPSDGDKPLSPDEAKKLQRRAESQIPTKSAEPPPASAMDPAAANEDYEPGLSVDQEQDVFYRPSSSTPPVLSALPRVRVPKTTTNIQEGDEHVPGGTNPDVFYHSDGSIQKSNVPSVEAVPEQGEPTAAMMKDLFHSRKVAGIFRGQNKLATSQDNLEPRRAERSAIDHTELNKNKDQDTFKVRTLSQSTPEEPIQSQHTSSGSTGVDPEIADLAQEVSSNAIAQPSSGNWRLEKDLRDRKPFQMQESRVPSSRVGRLWQYGSLATSMAFGAVGESFRRVTGSHQENSGSLMLGSGNMERLVAKLSRMRGAALKLGQMMSFQDVKMLPPAVNEILQRVQDSADYMPASQRNRVLAEDLGPNWRDLFESFDEIPMAAASIGQVHGAVLKSSRQRVAVKVQYPGVANSIDSDLNNLALLLTASRLLPKGLYLDKTIANARTELAWECDYIREAECARRFRNLLKDEAGVFIVPAIIDEASGKSVLTMERMEGVAVTKIHSFTQSQRDWIGTQILRLCLREITEFKYMQTDPNWTNFLYNDDTQKLELLDFGASRDYPDKFIVPYVQVLLAASRGDRKACRDLSVQLGYLTGHESQAMVNAHVSSILTLAEPFTDSAADVYDFQDQTITDRVRGYIPTMVRERLSPPPEETYSLHRKLSGAFLLCARLGSRIRCKELFANAVQKTRYI